MEILTAQRKPIIVECVQYTNPSDLHEIWRWLSSGGANAVMVADKLSIHTLGTKAVYLNDYITKVSSGEFYVYNPELHHNTYSVLENQ